MLNATADRRRFFRVDDTISLSYQLIDENTVAQGLKSSAYLNNEYSLAATLDVLSQEAMRIMQHLEKQNSEFLELYQVLDAKINAMAQAVMFIGSNVDAQNCQDVSLSAAGLAFQQQTALELGQNLAIEMYLPSTLALILVYGRVVNCQADDAGQHVISVEYTQIREEDQELLIKHVVRKQWQQLRESKTNPQLDA